MKAYTEMSRQELLRDGGLSVSQEVEQRAAAKKAKDWATADAIRAQLTEMGWAVKDTARGPQLSKS